MKRGFLGRNKPTIHDIQKGPSLNRTAVLMMTPTIMAPCLGCVSLGRPCLPSPDGIGCLLCRELNLECSIAVDTRRAEGGRRNGSGEQTESAAASISPHSADQMTLSSSLVATGNALIAEAGVRVHLLRTLESMANNNRKTRTPSSTMSASAVMDTGFPLPLPLPTPNVPRPPATRSAVAAVSTDTTMKTLSDFFALTDILLPTLHAGRIFSRRPLPRLLLAAFTLVTPYFAGERSAGTPGRSPSSPAAFAPGEAELFAEASIELSAALNTNVTSAELVASALILATFSIFRGRSKLAKELLVAAHVLGWRAGIFASTNTFSSARTFTFEGVVGRVFGLDWRERKMTPFEVAEIRELWIDFWTSERLAWSLYFLYRLLAGASPDNTDIFSNIRGAAWDPAKMIYRFSPPMPGLWNQSFAPNWDPRVVEPVAPLMDQLGWLERHRTDPIRYSRLVAFKDAFLTLRTVTEGLNNSLRLRVDAFLQACKEAGLASPFELPIAPSVLYLMKATPAIQKLLLLRTSLDADITEAWNAFPDVLRSAFHTANAGPALEAIAEGGGNFYFAFNRLPIVFSIPLMRLELFTSFGGALVFNNGQTTLSDSLGDEFGNPGGYADMLRDAIAYTRLLASWIKYNPYLESHVSSGLTVFRVLCLHVSSARKVRGLLEAAANANRRDVYESILGVLSDIEKDANTCLDILDRDSKKGSYLLPTARLARKLVDGERVTELDLAMHKMEVDLPDDSAGEQLGATPIFTSFESLGMEPGPGKSVFSVYQGMRSGEVV